MAQLPRDTKVEFVVGGAWKEVSEGLSVAREIFGGREIRQNPDDGYVWKAMLDSLSPEVRAIFERKRP